MNAQYNWTKVGKTIIKDDNVKKEFLDRIKSLKWESTKNGISNGKGHFKHLIEELKLDSVYECAETDFKYKDIDNEQVIGTVLALKTKFENGDTEIYSIEIGDRIVVVLSIFNPNDIVTEAKDDIADDEYYYVEIYKTIGEHSDLGTDKSFKEALQKGTKFIQNKKNLEGVEYVGVMGSGREFAVLYATEEYKQRLDNKSFDNDEKMYNAFIKVYNRVLNNNKPLQSKFPIKNETINEANFDNNFIEIKAGSHPSVKTHNKEIFKKLNSRLINDEKNPLYDEFQSEMLMLDDTNGFISILLNRYADKLTEDKWNKFINYLKTFLFMDSYIYIGNDMHKFVNEKKAINESIEYGNGESFLRSLENKHKIPSFVKNLILLADNVTFGSSNKNIIGKKQGNFLFNAMVDVDSLQAKLFLLSLEGQNPNTNQKVKFVYGKGGSNVKLNSDKPLQQKPDIPKQLRENIRNLIIKFLTEEKNSLKWK